MSSARKVSVRDSIRRRPELTDGGKSNRRKPADLTLLKAVSMTSSAWEALGSSSTAGVLQNRERAAAKISKHTWRSLFSTPCADFRRVLRSSDPCHVSPAMEPGPKRTGHPSSARRATAADGKKPAEAI